MTLTCQRAIRSLRVVAHIHLRQAKAAKRNRFPELSVFHARIALDCRRDANELRRTS